MKDRFSERNGSKQERSNNLIISYSICVHYDCCDCTRYIFGFFIKGSSSASTRTCMEMSLVMSTSRQFGWKTEVNMSAYSRTELGRQDTLPDSIFMVSPPDPHSNRESIKA